MNLTSKLQNIELSLSQLNPRSPDQDEIARTLSGELSEIQSAFADAMSANEQDAHFASLIHDLHGRVKTALREMPPSGLRFLRWDDAISLEQIEHARNIGDNIEPSVITLSGQMTFQFPNGSHVDVPHGTRIPIRTISGNRVEMMLPGNVRLLLGESDFPADGIPVEEELTGREEDAFE